MAGTLPVSSEPQLSNKGASTMRRPHPLVMVFLVATAAFLGSFSYAVQGDGVTDAPTGFAVVSNGFAEEFCANQAALTDSPNSPTIPNDECDFDTALEEFTGPETVADGL